MFEGFATYNEVEHVFTFNNGSILELATLQYADSVDNFQGAEYGVEAFEEITEFLESQVDYFKTRLRAPVDGPEPHLIATTNPGGVGHKWVKKEWVKPDPDDVVGGSSRPMTVWKAKPKAREPPMTRAFVPATLDDNPALTERDPTYRNRLKAIKDPKKRKAYEQGDWDAIEEVEGALWTQKALDEGRRHRHPRSTAESWPLTRPVEPTRRPRRTCASPMASVSRWVCSARTPTPTSRSTKSGFSRRTSWPRRPSSFITR